MTPKCCAPRRCWLEVERLARAALRRLTLGEDPQLALPGD
jgi:hypothetical protein